MPITFIVGSAAAGNDGSPSSVVSDAMDTTGANFCVVTVGDWDAYSDPFTVSDNYGNTWSQLSGYSVHNPLLGQQQDTFYSVGMACGPGHVVTVSRSNLYGGATFQFFSGVANQYPLDSAGGQALDAGNAEVTLGPIVPSVDQCLIVTGMISGTVDSTSTAGFIGPLSVPANFDFYSEAGFRQIQNAATSVSPVLTYPGADGLAAAFAVFRAAQGTPGLVAWWLCDEGSGSIAHDRSGNGNYLNLQSGAAFVPGQQGSAVALDGVNDRMGSAFEGPPATNALTLAMWINRGSLAVGGLLAKTNGGSWNYDLLISYADNRLTFYTDGFFPSQSSSSGQISDTGVWHHVAVTVGSNTVTFYIDGLYAGSYGVLGTMASNGGEYILVGDEGVSGPYFNGSVYDIRIYNTTLTPAQVLALAESPGSSHRAMGIGIGMGMR